MLPVTCCCGRRGPYEEEEGAFPKLLLFDSGWNPGSLEEENELPKPLFFDDWDPENGEFELLGLDDWNPGELEDMGNAEFELSFEEEETGEDDPLLDDEEDPKFKLLEPVLVPNEEEANGEEESLLDDVGRVNGEREERFNFFLLFEPNEDFDDAVDVDIGEEVAVVVDAENTAVDPPEFNIACRPALG